MAGENTGFIRGWCLEVNDLAIAKLVAGRSKDLDFLRHLVQGGYAAPATFKDRLKMTMLEEPVGSMVEQRLARLLALEKR